MDYVCTGLMRLVASARYGMAWRGMGVGVCVYGYGYDRGAFVVLFVFGVSSASKPKAQGILNTCIPN